MALVFFHMEKRGFIMIGSIFPGCYCFSKHFRWGDPIRRNIWKWAALAAAVGLAIGWFTRAQWTPWSFDWKLAAASLERVDWRWLLASLACMGGSYYGRALRWAVFVRPIQPEASVKRILVATVIGYTAITLLGRPGEFVRPYLIARKEGVTMASQLAGLLLERLFDLSMVLLVFSFALLRIRASEVHVGARLAWVLQAGGGTVAVLSAAVLALLLFLRHLSDGFRRWLLRALHFLPEARFRKLERLMGSFLEGVQSIRGDRTLLLVLLYSVLEWAVIAACYYCMARSFDAAMHLTLVDVLIFMGFVSFGTVIQIPGVGGGAQVVAVVVLTELFGIRLETATSFAVYIWILTLVAVIPVGLYLTLKEGLDWRSLRRLGKETSL
jgi:glycosyltransferase 2 family protein